MRFPLKIDFEVLKPFFRVLFMKFLTESENGMNEETQQGLKSLFRAPLRHVTIGGKEKKRKENV